MVDVLLVLWDAQFFYNWHAVDTLRYSVFRPSSYCLYCQYLIFGRVDTVQYPVLRDSILVILDNTQYLVHDLTGDNTQYWLFRDSILAILVLVLFFLLWCRLTLYQQLWPGYMGEGVVCFYVCFTYCFVQYAESEESTNSVRVLMSAYRCFFSFCLFLSFILRQNW